MRDVANRMGVNSLDRTRRQNQQNAKQREEDSPRALHIRFWPKSEHDKSNIAQDLLRKSSATNAQHRQKCYASPQHIEN
jgi:hypothetical protein